MKYHYQFVLIGSTDGLSERIIALFFDKVKELKIPETTFRIIKEENFHADYANNQPAFAVYFGDKNGCYRHTTLCEKLLKHGTCILPVYYEKEAFKRHIPDILHGQNGILYNMHSEEKIVNLALEAFHLLRNTRKIFISYKRSESSSVAIQLYEALEKNNFDVFLDTHSIKPGEPFQEELWHRMADCDVVLILNTKAFVQSDWCKYELAEANAKQIAIVQLLWPDQLLDAASEFSVPVRLKTTDFENGIFDSPVISRLTNEISCRIIKEIESVRARNLASRQDCLITEFMNLARKKDKKINLQPERFITEDLGENKKRIFIPMIGIPQSIDCNRSEELIDKRKEYDVESIFLIYDDLHIRNNWLNHLDWLNNYLKIKTMKKQQFSKWLKEN